MAATGGIQGSASEIDAMAMRVLDRADPIRFDLAETDETRRETWRLRYEVSISRGWMRPEDAPDGFERDDFDDDAVIIAGWDGPTLVATSRLVFPKVGRLLPTEMAFDVRVEPAGQVVNTDRILVQRDYSDPGHRVFAGLIAYTWLELRRRGFHICTGADSPAMIRLYRLLGMQISPIGPSRLYRGEKRQPCIFSAREETQEVPT